MKKIKLKLTVEQQCALGDMLRHVVAASETKKHRSVEYYVVAEWYGARASRFLFVEEGCFSLKKSEACAMWKTMKTFGWISPFADVATAILWQLDKHFAGTERERRDSVEPDTATALIRTK